MSEITALANLRHAYAKLAAGTVVDQKQLAEGLLSPAIATLEAALSSRSAEAGKPVVKALDWRDGPEGSYSFEAKTPWNKYAVWEIGGRGCWTPDGLPGTLVSGGLDAAKAAAQADYERRILSALAAPLADIEPLAARWMVEETLPSGSIMWEVVEHEHHARTIASRNPDNATVTPLYRSAPSADIEPVSVPDWWPLVPKVPTQQMIDAGKQWTKPSYIYDAMLEFAPAAPHPTKTEAVDADAVIERLTAIIRDGLKECDRSQRPSYAWQLRARAALKAKSPSSDRAASVGIRDEPWVREEDRAKQDAARSQCGNQRG